MLIFGSESESRSVVSDSLRPYGLFSPWNSPGQNTGLGSLSLLQGIFPTQRSNPGLPHCRQILYQLSHKGSQFCKAIILQLKIVINLNFKRKERNYKTNKHCLKQLSDFLYLLLSPCYACMHFTLPELVKNLL